MPTAFDSLIKANLPNDKMEQELKQRVAENEFWKLATTDGFNGARLDAVAVAQVIKIFMAHNRRYSEIKELQNKYNKFGGVMKKFCVIMLVLTLPLLCVVHIIFLIVCVPFLVIHETLRHSVQCVKELFDLRNTVEFAQGVLNKAYKLWEGQ